MKVSREIGAEAGLKGGYAGVTASVSAKFKRSDQRSSHAHFLKISHTHSGTSVFVEGGIEQLRSQLLDEFRDALNSGDPDALIEEYGTHVIRKIEIGGRAEYFAQSSSTSNLTEEEFEAAARAKYSALGGVADDAGSVEASAKARAKGASEIKDVVGSEKHRHDRRDLQGRDGDQIQKGLGRLGR